MKRIPLLFWGAACIFSGFALGSVDATAQPSSSNPPVSANGQISSDCGSAAYYRYQAMNGIHYYAMNVDSYLNPYSNRYITLVLYKIFSPDGQVQIQYYQPQYHGYDRTMRVQFDFSISNPTDDPITMQIEIRHNDAWVCYLNNSPF
jgi:hypothetical protein